MHRAGLRTILRRGDFRRLLGTRLASQLADGAFQASLAGTVFFNPDRQPDPLAVALGFAVLLLPYSLVGPFAGVLLDRWSRRSVLVGANLVRCLLIPLVAGLVWLGEGGMPFLLAALLVISVNRFFLSGLSASLPHVVPVERLVTANALSTTSGTMVFAVGGGIALALREVAGSDDHGYAAIALTAVLGYLASSALAAGFRVDQLGPDDTDRSADPSLVEVARGMAAGARHVAQRRVAGQVLLALVGLRVLYGASTIATLLLYKNYFPDGTVLRNQLPGLAQLVVVVAAGSLLAAVVTPPVTRRIPPRVWVTVLFGGAALAQVGLGLQYTPATLLAAAFCVAVAAQGVKIVTDTAVQVECDDDYRGRVFSVYDTLYNVALVAGLVLGALTLPLSGKSYAVGASIGLGYAVLAVAYGRASSRQARRTHRLPAAPGPAVEAVTAG